MIPTIEGAQFGSITVGGESFDILTYNSASGTFIPPDPGVLPPGERRPVDGTWTRERVPRRKGF